MLFCSFSVTEWYNIVFWKVRYLANWLSKQTKYWSCEQRCLHSSLSQIIIIIIIIIIMIIIPRPGNTGLMSSGG